MRIGRPGGQAVPRPTPQLGVLTPVGAALQAPTHAGDQRGTGTHRTGHQPTGVRSPSEHGGRALAAARAGTSVEVHPEESFAVPMSNPGPPRRRTRPGRATQQRLHALPSAGINLSNIGGGTTGAVDTSSRPTDIWATGERMFHLGVHEPWACTSRSRSASSEVAAPRTAGSQRISAHPG